MVFSSAKSPSLQYAAFAIPQGPAKRFFFASWDNGQNWERKDISEKGFLGIDSIIPHPTIYDAFAAVHIAPNRAKSITTKNIWLFEHIHSPNLPVGNLVLKQVEDFEWAERQDPTASVFAAYFTQFDTGDTKLSFKRTDDVRNSSSVIKPEGAPDPISVFSQVNEYVFLTSNPCPGNEYTSKDYSCPITAQFELYTSTNFGKSGSWQKTQFPLSATATKTERKDIITVASASEDEVLAVAEFRVVQSRGDVTIRVQFVSRSYHHLNWCSQ